MLRSLALNHYYTNLKNNPQGVQRNANDQGLFSMVMTRLTTKEEEEGE